MNKKPPWSVFFTAFLLSGLILTSIKCFDLSQASTDIGGTNNSPFSSSNASPTNHTITRIQSYQCGSGVGTANEPSVETSLSLENAPLQGNVLISVIGIQGMHTTSTDAQGVVIAPSSFETATVSSMSEIGVVWTRQVRSNSTALISMLKYGSALSFHKPVQTSLFI